MPFFPKIKTKSYGDRYDLEMVGGKFKIYFMEKYAIIQLIGDVLVGISFVTGSILNLTSAPAMYGNIAYLIGSLALIARPAIKIFRRALIYNLRKENEY